MRRRKCPEDQRVDKRLVQDEIYRFVRSQSTAAKSLDGENSHSFGVSTLERGFQAGIRFAKGCHYYIERSTSFGNAGLGFRGNANRAGLAALLGVCERIERVAFTENFQVAAV